ncbi:hypothetical protein [Actinomadura sp. HBU206391]|uniref:hypothetical protein n=1 Tax=Actinomadura sp. HBU206391 TaxID=2731692 RepID=UPI00164F7583|nr:hypothetical protein [Actinomadura sp. HBU206391]MBC6458679.1 hypothetical protein [Actinomadura sp. HBU206391]
MRPLVMLAGLLFLCLVAYLMARAFSGGAGVGRPAVEQGARWETHTEVGEGVTSVVVRRVTEGRSGLLELGRQVIRTIPDDDPEWDTKYHAAMAEARSRVAALEIESD